MHMTIRRILATAYVCLVLVFVFGRSRILLTNTARAVWEATPPKAAETAVDLLLGGGTVVDGTGSAPRQADVGIRGDRIAFIGNAKEAKLHAVRVLDARGLVIAPGFIDPHTHADADLSSATRNSNLNYLMQGVTTVIVGNDGLGTPRVTEMLEKWEQQGIGTNTGVLVGHGFVRREVLGLGDVQPTDEQLDQMRALVRGAMEQGAFGLSTGLYYVPGSFAKTEEVIELAKVAAAAGGIYDTHMRERRCVPTSGVRVFRPSSESGKRAPKAWMSLPASIPTPPLAQTSCQPCCRHGRKPTSQKMCWRD